jgi:hypothetical protein
MEFIFSASSYMEERLSVRILRRKTNFEPLDMKLFSHHLVSNLS